MSKRKNIGESHPLFQNGKSRDANGYVVLTSKKWGNNIGKREHRVIMENYLGRALNADEIVHHKNEDKSDNTISNLEILTRAEHNRKHGNGKLLLCTNCGAEKWYSQSVLNKITNIETYHCKPCSGGKHHKRNCEKCGSEYSGGKNSRFCGKCTRKNKCR